MITFSENTEMWNKMKNTGRWRNAGIELCGSFQSTERTLRSKSVLASLVNIGARPNALTAICGANLRRTIGITITLYGCEHWNNLTTYYIVSIERCQRFNAKHL